MAGFFNKYARDGKCGVCGKEDKVVVCSSTLGSVSFAYCKDCFKNKAEPYDHVVAYVSCIGKCPDDMPSYLQKHIRNILKLDGKTEEELVKDVTELQEKMSTINW